MRDPGLKAQVIFGVNFHQLLWDRHFQWLQLAGDMSKRAGFRSVNMPLHSYIMRRDLLRLQATWRTMPEYQDYFDIIESMPEATQAEKEIRVVLDKRFPKKFFEIALNTFDSNFDQWRQENLQLALGGDELPAQYLASWILGTPNPSDTSYESSAHDTTIGLDDMMQYLTALELPQELQRRRFFVHSTLLQSRKFQWEHPFGEIRVCPSPESLLSQNRLHFYPTPSL
jgi:hypothetical protein